MSNWKIVKANLDNERAQHNRILKELELSTQATFETVSKNLSASGATFNYSMDRLSTIVYANGITKTFNFTGDKLTSIVLSGTTPAGVSLTKTLGYTGDSLTSISYS